MQLESQWQWRSKCCGGCIIRNKQWHHRAIQISTTRASVSLFREKPSRHNNDIQIQNTQIFLIFYIVFLLIKGHPREFWSPNALKWNQSMPRSQCDMSRDEFSEDYLSELKKKKKKVISLVTSPAAVGMG